MLKSTIRNSNAKPLNIENGEWDGRPYTTEFYATTTINGLSPIKQVQAVCFDEQDNIVLYRHKKGWNGLPGGHIEENDKDLGATLRREILEEVAAELVSFGVIGYEKVWWHDSPQKIHYHVRYWAKVKLLASAPNDPDGKALERVVCSHADAFQILGYGKKGDIILKLAIDQH